MNWLLIERGLSSLAQGDILAMILLALKSSSNQRESNILSEIYGKYQQ